MKKEKVLTSLFAAILSFSASCLPINAIGADISASSSTITFAATDGESEDDNFLLGDVDNDHVITPRDASLALCEYALISTTGKGSFTEAEMKRADVDNNKWIDPADSSYILSYYAYLSTGGQLSMEEFMKNPFMPPMTTTTTKPKATTTKSKETTTTTTSTKSTTTKTTETAKSSTTTTTKPTTTSTSTTTSTTTTTTTATSTTTSTSASSSTTDATATSATTTSYADPAKVASIDLTRTEMEINVGEGALSAYVTMNPPTAANKAEKWTSSDESVAVVDSEGWVIGKKEGTCIITVTSVDNPEVSAKITVTVIDKSHVKEIKLSRDSMTIKIGEGALSAYVTMLPETAVNKNEIWSSSDKSIAIVDSEGWVIGKKAGNCKITVKSEDNPNILAVINVTVTDGNSTSATTASTASSTTASTIQSTTTTATTVTTEPTGVKVTEIRLSKTKITVPIGGSDLSWVTMLPADASNKDEIWISSDESIATVDKYGWIRGIAVGECTVTVISANNPDVKAEIAVTVVSGMENPPKPDVLFSSIAPNQPDGNYIAFKTPLPENIQGRFIIDFVITDDNGTVTSISSPVILLPEMESVITNLKAATNKFTAVGYVTNLTTEKRVELGRYSFVTSPRDASTQTENIKVAFDQVK